MYVYNNISLNYSYDEKCFRQTLLRKIRRHILCSITYFQKLCHLCNNMLKHQRTRQATDDNIIQCMCIVCCITRATDTHSEYVAFTALLWQQWLRKPPSTLCLYTQCLSCYIYNLSTLE